MLSVNSNNSRFDCFESMSYWATSGLVCGALAGFAVSVWVAHEILEPALEDTNGINKSGAQALTALIWLAGGGEAFITGGALAGTLAFSMLGCCFGGVCQAVSCAAENSNRFFSRSENTSTNANGPAPRSIV